MREILFRGKPIVCEELMEPNETLKEFFERQQGWSAYSVNAAFTDDGFVIGQVVYSHVKAWIVGEVMEAEEDYIALEYWVPVKPETVGQYTGLRDKNGVKIFEGDVVQRRTPIYKLGEKAPIGEYLARGKVVWDESSFTEVGYYTVSTYDHLGNTTKTILFNGVDGWHLIGNIYDNPELSGGI